MCPILSLREMFLLLLIYFIIFKNRVTSHSKSRKKCLGCKQTTNTVFHTAYYQLQLCSCTLRWLILKGYPSLMKCPLPPDRPHLVSRPVSITPCFCCPSSHSKTSPEGLPVPVLTRGGIPKVACVQNGSPGLFQIGVCRPRWGGDGGSSLLLLSWREGNWASEDVDSTDMGHERICQRSGGWRGGKYDCCGGTLLESLSLLCFSNVRRHIVWLHLNVMPQNTRVQQIEVLFTWHSIIKLWQSWCEILMKGQLFYTAKSLTGCHKAVFLNWWVTNQKWVVECVVRETTQQQKNLIKHFFWCTRLLFWKTCTKAVDLSAKTWLFCQTEHAFPFHCSTFPCKLALYARVWPLRSRLLPRLAHDMAF